MSNKVQNKSWGMGELTISARLVLVCLADRADNDGVCYPSVGDIIERTALSRSQVQRCLRELEKAGHLSVNAQRGRHNRSVYIVHPKGRTGDTFSAEEKAAEIVRKGRNRTVKKAAQNHSPTLLKEPPLRTTTEPPSGGGNIFTLQDQLSPGSVTALIRDEMQEFQDRRPFPCIEHCYREAAGSSGRHWNFVKAFLIRHEKEGCDGSEQRAAELKAQWERRRNGTTSGPSPEDPTNIAAAKAYIASGGRG